MIKEINLFENKERVIQAIENWGDPVIVWLHLFSLIGEKHKIYSNLNNLKISHNHQKFNLSLHASCGTGKSYNTIVLANFLQEFIDMPFIVELYGNYTAKALVEKIVETPDATFYIDESEHFMADMTIRALLRQMCFGKGIVSWQTSRESQNINLLRFKGNTIMSRNDKIDDKGRILDISNEHLLANLDRAIIITLKPTIDEIIKIKQKQYQNQIDKEAWGLIANRIVELRKSSQEVNLSEPETKELFGFWEQELKDSKEDLISLRSYDKLIQLTCRMKLFFGCLDQDLMRICKFLGRRMIKTSILKDDLNEIVNNKDIKRADLTKELSEERQISLRQAQRIVSKAINEGRIREVNQVVV